MTGKQLLGKIKAYPLALSLLGVAILLAGWAYYRGGAEDDALAQLDQVNADNNRVAKNVTDGQHLDQQYAQLTDDAKKFNDALINPADIIPNQQYFYDFEQTTGVQILDPTQGITDRSKDFPDVSTTTITLSASGHWDNMVAFIYGLQTGPHLLRIDHLLLEKTAAARSSGASGSDYDRLNLTLTVEVLGK